MKLNDAVEAYTEAIDFDATNAVYYSNRAFCFIKLESFGLAIIDATKGIEVVRSRVVAHPTNVDDVSSRFCLVLFFARARRAHHLTPKRVSATCTASLYYNRTRRTSRVITAAVPRTC
jgi:hypothetical protein